MCRDPDLEDRMSADDTTNDVGSWVTVLARNWWVIAGLIVLGAVVGALLTLTSPKVYTATSSVYIGQTTDANGTPMAGLNSNIKASTQLVSSQAVLIEAAKRAGMGITAGLLRREVTVETPSQAIKTTTSAVNLVVISVTDTKKVRAAAAARTFLVSVTLMTTRLTAEVVVLMACDGVSTVTSRRSRPAVMPMPARLAASLSTAWLETSWVDALMLELRPAMGVPLASVVCPM